MANTKKSSTSKKSPAKKTKAPIKVEKIVDAPASNRKEIYAIIVGVLIVLSLVAGSVIYFSNSDEPLTQKPVNNNDDIIEIEDDEDDTTEEETVKKLNNVVSKECTTCTVIVVETLDRKVNKEYPDYDAEKTDESYFVQNDLESKTYYKSEQDSYLIIVKGSVTTAAEDKEALETINKVLIAKQTVKENEDLTEEQKEAVLSNLGIKDIKETGLIVVGNEDTTYASNVFVVRIEESKDKVDWSKGVTVNGTVYYDTVTDKVKNEYLLQDEEGINITVAVSKDDLGASPVNEPIVIDVEYTTGTGEAKSENYELDLTEVSIEYEDVSSLPEDTDLTEYLDTEEKMDTYLEESEEALNIEIDTAITDELIG